MKNYFLFLIFILQSFFSLSQNWQILNPKTNSNDILSICFTNKTTAYFVGNIGTIVKTTDDGINWTNQLSGTKRCLRSVCYTDSSTLYIVGDSGTIIKTSNAGSSWSFKLSGTNKNLHSVFFTNSATGYATGDSGIVLKTTDGGNTWNYISIDTNSLYSICFTDSVNGYTVGSNGIIYKTTDGGNNWIFLNSGTTKSLNSVYFTDSITVHVAGDYAIILKTTDAGNNWVCTHSPVTIGWEEINGICFTSNNVGYATGGYSGGLGANGGYILKTTNGGNSWYNLAYIGSKYFNAISFVDSTTGFLAGAYGLMYKINDNGNANLLSSGFFYDLRAVNFPEDSIGFIIGNSGAGPQYGYGRILKSTDGGLSWQQKNISATNNWYMSSCFIDSNNGYVCTRSGLLKTTDGGDTWNIISSVVGAFWSVSFSDINHGIAVGQAGLIYTTNDGGVNWYSDCCNTFCDNKSVCYSDATTAYIVGECGTIIKSNNNNNNFLNSGVSQTLNSVCFLNSNTGIAVGNNGTIIKTIDGGNNWLIINIGVTTDLNSIYFIQGVGYIVGSGGAIFKTNDNGNTWQYENSATLNRLYSVYLTQTGLGFAVGENGMILKNSSVVFINKDEIENNLKIYPNPTKSKIIIDISNFSQNCKLQICNYNGQEVIQQQMKDNLVEIDMSNLANGVYFLKLITDKTVEVRKIIKD
ncbi:MAG: YCF48-related protein [Bacteroidales bacterium]